MTNVIAIAMADPGGRQVFRGADLNFEEFPAPFPPALRLNS
jgi:hypothetical protein